TGKDPLDNLLVADDHSLDLLLNGLIPFAELIGLLLHRFAYTHPLILKVPIAGREKGLKRGVRPRVQFECNARRDGIPARGGVSFLEKDIAVRVMLSPVSGNRWSSGMTNLGFLAAD